MQMPFKLVPRDVPGRADAVVVFTDAAADVLRVVGLLGTDWPEVFHVADGFVVIAGEPVAHAVPGVVRLRRLAGSLFVPSDADLRPTLRADEAIALTRSQGLVLLPQVTALSFDPESPLREVDFLTPPARSGRVWGPLPVVPRLPTELTVIEADLPRPAAILDLGEPGGAAPLSANPDAPVPEGARPPGAGFFKTAAEGAKLGLGRVLSLLGRAASLPSLAALGAGLAKSALEAVPRLTESILGKQESALREVLRQLERGNVEEALRRAPPAFADPDAPKGRIDAGTSLGTRNTSFSLASLLGGTGAGVGWLGGGDVWGQLAANYRKLAEDAVRRGDVRRAAYIYGVLLRDLRSAANALAGGGLHRNAAILYRDKVKDLAQAATQFERAGDFDEALRLYLKLDQYEPAAELMRRLGDEARAVELFRRAADRLAATQRHRDAGDLVRDKAGDLEAAEGYYAQGWHGGGAGRMACAERLIDLHAAGERWHDLAVMLTLAETRFAPPHTEEASRFYELALRHEAAMPPAFREDVRDQARLALAGHLRDHTAANTTAKAVVSQAFGGRAGWSGALVRDAGVALKHALTARPKPAAKHGNAILSKLVTGPVTACVATPSGSVIAAGLHGETQRYVSPTGGVETVQGPGAYATSGECKLVALATDEDAKFVVNLVEMDIPEHPWKLHSFARGDRGTYQFCNCVGWKTEWAADSVFIEGTIVRRSPDSWHTVRVLEHTRALLLSLPSLATDLTTSYQEIGSRHYFSVTRGDASWRWESLLVGYFHAERKLSLEVSSGWTPGSSHTSALEWPPVSWVTPELDALELAGVDVAGLVHWSRFSCERRSLTGRHARGVCLDGYAVACLTGPGQVVAVTAERRVVQLRADGSGTLAASPPVAEIDHASRAVFAAYQPAVREVVVVFADGWMARVKI